MIIPPGVGWTALMVAAQRAAESSRPRPLFRDPLALALVDMVGDRPTDAGPGLLYDADGHPTEMTRSMGDYLAARTMFFDERLAECWSRDIHQCVILGAGMDGRAFRLPVPAATRFFEVDTAEVLDFKDEVIAHGALSAGVSRRPVRQDLRDHWLGPLADAGFAARQPTVWVLEGLLFYLSSAECDALLDLVSGASAPGSRLLADYPDLRGVVPPTPSDAASSRFYSVVESGPSAEPGRWLPPHQWEPAITLAPEYTRRLGRRPSPEMPVFWWVDAVRR